MPDTGFSLLLRTSPVRLAAKTDECTVIQDITNISQKWRRNILFNGGADVGTFQVFGNIDLLREVYSTWLGLDIVERFANMDTWNGQIYRLELHYGSIPVALDMSQMYNRIKAADDGGTWGSWSSWTENDESVAKYGQRELIISPDTNTTIETAQQVSYQLKLFGNPLELPCSSGKATNSNPYIKVYVAGYKATMNDLYAPVTFITANTSITTTLNVITGQAKYVTSRKVVTNSTKITEDLEQIRTWDLISNLLKMSDSQDRLYRGWIDSKRNFNYTRPGTTPSYYIKGGIVYGDGLGKVVVAPRLLQPGIYRNLDWPFPGENRTDVLEDRADILIDDITINEHGTALFKPRGSKIGDFVVLFKSESFEFDPDDPLWDFPNQDPDPLIHDN